MNWLLPRMLPSAFATFVGGWIGMLLGGMWNAPTGGAIVGAAAGAGLCAVLEAWRGHRFIDWLKGPQSASAPRDAGFWGEVGYRVERSVRLLENRVDGERRRLDQFLSAIEASPNGVMMLDEGDHIEWCNSVSADHFGLNPVRDRRQRVTNLVRAPVFVAYLQEGDFSEPITMHGTQGRSNLSVLVRPYGDGMKLVLSQDVTERERNDAMRRDFVANVSHEIRTPLTVLSGFIETLGNLPLTTVERRRVIELMTQQTQRMQMLVSDLLTLAQLEGSPRPPADRWVSMQRLIQWIRADAEVLSAGRHHLSFGGTDDFQIAGTETELFSAIANLVGNAIRYTPQGGSVDVRWSLRPEGGGELEVKDSGVGIEKEHISRLTERFYRVDGSRSRETGGTGLGLSIVKHVIQRHGGELDIRSEPGKGSTFKLVFPASRIRRMPVSSAVDTTAAVPASSLSR